MAHFSQRTRLQQPTLSSWGKAAATGIGVKDGYGVATGGNTTGPITDSVSYTLKSFTSDGTLVVTTAGLFDVLLVGGGGGGAAQGGGDVSVGGGGGGGGVFRTTVYLDATSYAVTVGAAGTGNTQRGYPSIIAVTSTLTTVGGISAVGGGTSRINLTLNTSEQSGGCGAGSVQFATNNGDGVVGQGFAGGHRQHMGGTAGGAGGGGGAGAAGGNASGTTGGNGGAGKDVSTFFGQVATTTYKGGGGGGGGSGANGSSSALGGGEANTGGGGSGATNNTSATSANNGYTGAVYVRFKI